MGPSYSSAPRRACNTLKAHIPPTGCKRGNRRTHPLSFSGAGVCLFFAHPCLTRYRGFLLAPFASACLNRCLIPGGGHAPFRGGRPADQRPRWHPGPWRLSLADDRPRATTRQREPRAGGHRRRTALALPPALVFPPRRARRPSSRKARRCTGAEPTPLCCPAGRAWRPSTSPTGCRYPLTSPTRRRRLPSRLLGPPHPNSRLCPSGRRLGPQSGQLPAVL